jgi:PadR family transcriptional regulator PadR
MRGHRRRWTRGFGGPGPRHIARFAEPCLLLLLHQGPSHGYNLIEDLKAFGFDGIVDTGTVYRYLRVLEHEGLVESDWEVGGVGPARRVYHLTDEGEHALAWWAEDLKQTDAVLHRFFEKYSTQVDGGKEPAE